MKYKCIKIFSILILIILFINLKIGFVFADTNWTQENMHLVFNEYRTEYDFSTLETTLTKINSIKIQFINKPGDTNQTDYSSLKKEIQKALEGEKLLRQDYENSYNESADSDKKTWSAKKIADFLNIKYKYDERWHGANQSVDVLEAWEDTIQEAISNNEVYIENLSDTSENRDTRLNIRNSYDQLALDIKNYEDALRKIQNSPNIEFKEDKDWNNKIYQQPSRYNTTSDGNLSLDDMINDADSFIDSGDKLTYNETALQNFSKSLYNIAMSVGIIVAVIVGAIIGIELMSASIERKVEAKKLLVPYVAGCVIVFGGFTIWKLVIEILQKV